MMVEARIPPKMEVTRAAKAAETEGAAESRHKQKGRKSDKTQAQKDAHNARCVQYRLNKKRRHEELEQVETKYYEMVPKFKQMQTKFKQMQTENQVMQMELKLKESKILCLENFIQELKTTRETQAANEARMRLIPAGWKVNGQNFTSFEESVEWFASQTNLQDCQVSGTVSQDANEFEGLGAIGTGDFLTSMAVFGQQMGFDLDYIDITASAAGPFSVANHGLPLVFDAPNIHGVGVNPAAGSSIAANNYPLPVFDAPNNHYKLVNNDLAAGVLTDSAAAGGSSFGVNVGLPIMFNAANKQANDGNLFTQRPAASRFQLCENPLQKQFVVNGLHETP